MIGINSIKNNNRIMDKRLFSLLFVVFLLTSVSAIYGGESVTIDVGQEYEYYSIVGNTSEVILDIQQNGTLITITPDKYSIDDTYEIIFFDQQKETIIVYRGGGGSRTRYVYENVTEYINKTIEVEKIVEVEVPGEDSIIEKIIEVTSKRRVSNIVIGVLTVLLLLSLLWNFKKDDKIEETHDIIKREEKNKDE